MRTSLLVWLSVLGFLCAFLCTIFLSIIVGILLVCVFACVFLLKFTFVKEGTAKIVMKFGAFHKILLSKKGYVVNKNGDIVEEKDSDGTDSHWHLLGGLRFVGIRGIHTIYRRDLSWVKSLPDGKFEDRVDNSVDFILARVDYQYGMRIISAESKDLLNLDANMTITASIINPYKAQFAVRDWFDAMVNRIAPYVREYISNHTYEELINDAEKQLDREIIKDLKTKKEGSSDSILNKLENFYGIKIFAIETININPPEEYRKASLSKWQASRDAEKRLGSTTGALMEMIAHQTGMDLATVQEEFKADPSLALKKYKGLIEINKDFIEQQIASEAGSLRRYYFNGGAGGMDLVALLGDVFRGSNQNQNASDKKEDKKKKPSEMTSDELEDEWEKDQQEG